MVLKKTPRIPLETEVNLILRKNGSTGLRTMGLRRPRKNPINFTNAVSLVSLLQKLLEHRGLMRK